MLRIHKNGLSFTGTLRGLCMALQELLQNSKDSVTIAELCGGQNNEPL